MNAFLLAAVTSFIVTGLYQYWIYRSRTTRTLWNGGVTEPKATDLNMLLATPFSYTTSSRGPVSQNVPVVPFPHDGGQVKQLQWIAGDVQASIGREVILGLDGKRVLRYEFRTFDGDTATITYADHSLLDAAVYLQGIKVASQFGLGAK